MRKIIFNNDDPESKVFTNTLNKRVNDYFKENGISKYGNATMYVKTVVMLSLYIIPYILIILMQPPVFIAWLLTIVMGVGMAGIGLSIMHDAIHGSYSRHKWVNKMLGYTLNLVGGNAINWKIQHNVKHHTYTNVEDHDEDISPKLVLRFSPNSEMSGMHKYQYIYAWFFYGLGTLFWVTFKDFIKFYNYHKEGLLEKNSKSIASEILVLVVTKIVYYSYIIAIPVFFTEYSGWQIFAGFLMMHFVGGMGLAVIFQPAHLMEEVKYPAPDAAGNMKYSWTVHQLHTTINFATANRFLGWFAGGLNFQIEHHLFPHVCHVHYHKISEIVESTAKEFELPYYHKPTFTGALGAHINMLKWLGTEQSLAPA